MQIKNFRIRGKRIATSTGEIQFDENGIAEVDEEFALLLAELKGYEVIEEQADEENSNLTDGQPNTEENELADEQPNEESNSKIFDSMTIEQLRQYAKDNNIDLKGASKKSDILSIIQ